MAVIEESVGTWHLETIPGIEHDAIVPCSCRIGIDHMYSDWLNLPENAKLRRRAEEIWSGRLTDVLPAR